MAPRIVAIVAAACIAVLAHGRSQAQEAVLRLPAEKAVALQGMVEATGGAAGGFMLYGPGLIGVAISLAIQSAVVSSNMTAEEKARQDAADALLAPLKPALADWSHEALMAAAVQRLGPTKLQVIAGGGTAPASAWTVDVAPLYLAPRGLGALVLDATMSLTAPGAPATAATKHLIRVVSAPAPVPAAALNEAAPWSSSGGTAASAPTGSVTAAPTQSTATAASAAASAPLAPTAPTAAEQAAINHWSSDEGRRLKAEAALMLAHAVELALQQAKAMAQTPASAAAAVPERTHRYMLGATSRAERGQLLAQSCGRVIVTTLRGNLLSAPRVEVNTPCADAYAM
jgi:hypothetical protein